MKNFPRPFFAALRHEFNESFFVRLQTEGEINGGHQNYQNVCRGVEN